jgi:hypothetical protein
MLTQNIGHSQLIKPASRRRRLRADRRPDRQRANWLVFAFANYSLFVLYIVPGHRIASASRRINRVDAGMLIAMIAALPIGIADAVPAFPASMSVYPPRSSPMSAISSRWRVCRATLTTQP